eukprot:Rhum_TRINITY_DN7433_c1_g1::Rhum_TRINITY_DN7433_c1_g1_i1::g.23086::m.23086
MECVLGRCRPSAGTFRTCVWPTPLLPAVSECMSSGDRSSRVLRRPVSGWLEEALCDTSVDSCGISLLSPVFRICTVCTRLLMLGRTPPPASGLTTVLAPPSFGERGDLPCEDTGLMALLRWCFDSTRDPPRTARLGYDELEDREPASCPRTDLSGCVSVLARPVFEMWAGARRVQSAVAARSMGLVATLPESTPRMPRDEAVAVAGSSAGGVAPCASVGVVTWSKSRDARLEPPAVDIRSSWCSGLKCRGALALEASLLPPPDGSAAAQDLGELWVDDGFEPGRDEEDVAAGAVEETWRSSAASPKWAAPAAVGVVGVPTEATSWLLIARSVFTPLSKLSLEGGSPI